MSKQQFDSKIRALRIDLEHAEGFLKGRSEEEYKRACDLLDQLSGKLVSWGDTVKV